MDRMTPQIVTSPERKLVGMRRTMSLADNNVADLWKSFMPRLKEITHIVSLDLYSVTVYASDYFENYDPAKEFEKWAAAGVTGFDFVPNRMETLILPEGLYAVFHYKGRSDDTSVFRTIFETWLPNSDYALDNRPHFEILGEKYRNNDPASEEEIWIPVKKREKTGI